MKITPPKFGLSKFKKLPHSLLGGEKVMETLQTEILLTGKWGMYSNSPLFIEKNSPQIDGLL